MKRTAANPCATGSASAFPNHYSSTSKRSVFPSIIHPPSSILSSPPRGTSLVEIIVSMGVSSVMLGLGMLMLHQLIKAERHATASVVFDMNWDRLSRTFRRDLHAAAEAALEQPAGQPPALVLRRPADATTIRYEWGQDPMFDRNEVRRIRRTGNQPPQTDSFRIPEGSEVTISQPATNEADARPLWQLTLSRPTVIVGAPQHTSGKVYGLDGARHHLTVEAQLGRDLRFAQESPQP